MRTLFVLALSTLFACNSEEAPATPEAAPVEAAAADVEQVPAAVAEEAADAAEAGEVTDAAAGEAHADAGDAHQGHEGAACTCSKGKQGETIWCETCSKGYINGQATTDKAEIDAAIASTAD